MVWLIANGLVGPLAQPPPLGLAARARGRAAVPSAPSPPASQTAAASSTWSHGPNGAHRIGTSIPSRSHSGVRSTDTIIVGSRAMPQAFYEQHDDVGELVLDAPPLNLFGPAMFDDLEAAIAEVQEASPRALIFRAQGDVVSAGVDVHVFEGLDAAGADELTARLMRVRPRDRGPAAPDPRRRARAVPHRRARAVTRV